VAGWLKGEGIAQEAADRTGVALNELLLNAMEHGSMGVNFDRKQRLMESGEYEAFIREQFNNEEVAKKVITVEAAIHDDEKLLACTVRDGGKGFDASDLFKRLNFDKKKRYHGRGILVACEMGDGLFFNEKGNEALFVLTLEEKG